MTGIDIVRRLFLGMDNRSIRSFKNKIIWINPSEIKYFSPPPNWWWYARLEKRIKNIKIKKILENFAMGDLFYSGNWDLGATQFSESDWVKNIKTISPDYNSYKLSSWYQLILKQINEKGFYKHKDIILKTRFEIDNFFENYLGGIIISLKKNGFIIDDKNSNDIPKILIGRNGELIKSGNGCHRLAIIQEFELKCKFPTQIIGIHKKFNIDGTNANKLNYNDIYNFIITKFGKNI